MYRSAPSSSFPTCYEVFLSIFKHLRYVFSQFLLNWLNVAQRKRREDEAKAVGGDALGMQISMSGGQPDTLSSTSANDVRQYLLNR